MHIVLHEPEIPGNTGNIGRSCVVTGTPLHLIEPLGFSISEKAIRRAGLDYWKDLEVHTYAGYEEFLETTGCVKNDVSDSRGQQPVIWYATTKAHQTYADVRFGPDDYIMFGKESAGIPEEILVENEAHCIRIPMLGEYRSLNLSNSVAIVLYEALRQNGFAGLEQKGALHRLHWRNRE